MSTWARAIQTPPSQIGRRAFKARTSIMLESLCDIPYPIQRTTCTQSSTCVVGHFPSRQSHYATDIVATEPGQSHWKLIKSRPPGHRAHRIPHPYQRQGKSLLRRAAAEAVRPVGKCAPGGGCGRPTTWASPNDYGSGLGASPIVQVVAAIWDNRLCRLLVG